MKTLYTAAIEGTREDFETAARAPELIGHQYNKILPLVQFGILMNAAWAIRRRKMRPKEIEAFIQRAATSKRWTGELVDVDYARRLLSAPGWEATASQPRASDHLDYVGRIMPTVVALTATALRQAPPNAIPREQRIDRGIRIYRIGVRELERTRPGFAEWFGS